MICINNGDWWRGRCNHVADWADEAMNTDDQQEETTCLPLPLANSSNYSPIYNGPEATYDAW